MTASTGPQAADDEPGVLTPDFGVEAGGGGIEVGVAAVVLAEDVVVEVVVEMGDVVALPPEVGVGCTRAAAPVAGGVATAAGKALVGPGAAGTPATGLPAIVPTSPVAVPVVGAPTSAVPGAAATAAGVAAGAASTASARVMWPADKASATRNAL
jgi:hypothetical protein